MDCIVALAGPSKAGKTALATRLAAALHVPFASFGDYVRNEAQRRGSTSVTPRQLQELGLELVKKDIKGFCKAVLEEGGYAVGRGLIIDGIRHMDALAAIKALAFRQPVKLVYIESSMADRVERSSFTTRQLEEIDAHAVESDRLILKSAADLVLNTSVSVEECFESLLRWTVQGCD